MADGVDELVRVANAKAGEKHAGLVGAAVAVRVAQMDEAVEVAHIRTARAGLHALHHGEPLGEAGAFISDAVVVRVLQHEDEVGGLHTRQRVRVGGGAGHPEAAFFIPGELHRLHHTLRLGGEKAHLIPLGHPEAGDLLLRRQHRLRRGLRRLHRRGFRRGVRLALRGGVDERVMPGDERLVRLEALAQGERVGGGLAEHLRHAVAIDEGPVRGPPAVEPQAVLFHNGLPQRGQVIRVTGGNPELLADDAPHHAQTLGIQMQAVIREARRLRTATGELGEKIHKQRATLPGDLPHGVGIGLHVVISQSQVRRVRRMGRVRLFKRHRRDEHQPRRARAELVQQPVIRRGELRHARLAIEGLHLAELADHHARAHRRELRLPVAEIQIPPLLIHRVPLPGHAAEARLPLRQLVGEDGLQRARLLLPHQILLPCQDNHLPLRDLEAPVLKRRGHHRRRLGIAKALLHLRPLRHQRVRQLLDHDLPKSDHRLAVAVDLQSDAAFQRDARLPLRVVHRARAIEPELDALVLGADLIAVPLARFLDALDLQLVRLRQHRLAPGLVIQMPRVTRADVRLIADHLIRRLADALAAELHPAVHKTLRARELVLEAQDEVPVLLRRRQKLILRIPLHGAAENDTLLDAPRLLRVALPAREGFAVKQRHWSGQGGSKEKERQKEQSADHGGKRA